ncbi:MAG: peptidylprolyl isomerase [Parcubacteria group bacterium]
MDDQAKKTGKQVAWSTIAIALLIFVAAYFIMVGILVVSSPTLAGKVDQNRLIQKTVALVPYPAAMVGGKTISDKKLFGELASVRRFYENQDFSKLGMRVDFSTEDGKKRLEINGRKILNKLIDDAIIQAEARKRGIVLSSEMINQEVDRMLKEYGTGDSLKDNLEKLYGWNVEDFKENIVKSDLYTEKLIGYMQEKDPAFVAVKDKVVKAQNDLKDGMSFSEAVKKYSEGESAKDSGELGWFSADQMLPEVAVAVFPLPVGQQSEIIRSSIGYHIVKVEDKKTENDVTKVKVSQIFVRTQPFSDWLKAAEKNYRVTVFLREFRWNNDTQAVEFRAGDMQKYEKDMENNPSSDPSIIF